MSKQEIGISFEGGLKVAAEIKTFRIRTDQSIGDGGDGSEPSPFDLFLASLATCAGFYVLSFCRERDIATDEIRMSMTTEKTPGSKWVGKIAIRIDLPPGFPEKYRTAVVKAAESCTVKAHLHTPPAFDITAAIRK